ncbi:signal peptidase II, partial [Candidatus Woesearchaeota archaeon]
SGIISNLIDRLAFGYVIDYIDLRIWPAFNIADVAITIGVLMLFIQLRTPCKA